MTNLNPAYDAAKPDVVIITLGADDVSFADIFIFCATGYTDAAQVAALAAAPDRSRQLRANYVKRFPTHEAWLNRPPRATSSSYCTAANPGSRRPQSLLGPDQQRPDRRQLQEPGGGDQGARRAGGQGAADHLHHLPPAVAGALPVRRVPRPGRPVPRRDRLPDHAREHTEADADRGRRRDRRRLASSTFRASWQDTSSARATRGPTASPCSRRTSTVSRPFIRYRRRRPPLRRC